MQDSSMLDKKGIPICKTFIKISKYDTQIVQ